MRLYNQTSRNPLQSASSLDSKKWTRPRKYLPETYREADTVTNRSTITENRNDAEDRKLTATNFLFDIDEEISMTSSSTLSTHTTFLKDQPDTCRLGLAKPFPGLQETTKVSYTNDANPFEVLRTSANHKKELHQSKPVRLDQVCTTKGHMTLDESLFSVPEMTLTASSSEESPFWQDFSSESFSCNPFRVKGESLNTNKKKQEITRTPIKTKERFPLKTQGQRGSIPKCDFTKYSGMMIRGISVAEVTQIMAQDQIDPSIISLVVVAASDKC
ncbi:MAG: hypothetical protein SGILL_002740 [Bacillariaceae sp.]